MLVLKIHEAALWNEATERFVIVPDTDLLLEHSLVSLSKWESLTEKPFLGREAKTRDETIEYVKCMTISPVKGPEVYFGLSDENFKEIRKYIDQKMTATIFSDTPGGKSSGEVVTSEIIYYWMIALNIPFECQYWHLNRLLALVKVLNLKNGPKKKMTRREIFAQQRTLNEQRKAQFNTSG
jgi:hypothetical protein